MYIVLKYLKMKNELKISRKYQIICMYSTKKCVLGESVLRAQLQMIKIQSANPNSLEGWVKVPPRITSLSVVLRKCPTLARDSCKIRRSSITFGSICWNFLIIISVLKVNGNNLTIHFQPLMVKVICTYSKQFDLQYFRRQLHINFSL